MTFTLDCASHACALKSGSQLPQSKGTNPVRALQDQDDSPFQRAEVLSNFFDPPGPCRTVLLPDNPGLFFLDSFQRKELLITPDCLVERRGSLSTSGIGLQDMSFLSSARLRYGVLFTSPWIFFNRPISGTVMGFLVLFVLFQVVKISWKRFGGKT